MIERLLHSRHQLEKVFSILEHSQVSESNEDQRSQGFGLREKLTQVILSK